MSVDYRVYLGPYIEIKTKGLTRKVIYDHFACRNKTCKRLNKAIDSKVDQDYCAACGKPIKNHPEEVEEEWFPLEMAAEEGILNEVCPDGQDEDEEGDTQLWFPRLEIEREMSWSVKYDSVWEDMTDLDVKAEIAKVESECANALVVLERVYGSKPVIKWGIIGGAS
jgi:hypothetical protein